MTSARQMSLTPELVSLCYRKVAEGGDPEQWPRLTEAEHHAVAKRLLDECGREPLWIFAFGSLIWKQPFDPVETRRGTAVGWHRSFCMKLDEFRGTPEQPGLMMALDRGGSCAGAVFRLDENRRHSELFHMVRREMPYEENLDMVRWIKVVTETGVLRALVFWAGPKEGEWITLKLPLEKVARVLARACGYAGSGAEYLYNTVSHLEGIGIRDRNLWRLQKLVADEIARIYGPPTVNS